ncbi:Peptidase S28 like protein [Aduncisulcus paluster]|uniref:Peptidase S28 like protein n=1 Tax=Aduncisulcus paluster TaxID=2918883 RepID=A0ABQ5K0W9_9EUKA|nr:Peptidase S28 like protein [Aduncisulcus paluster]
MNKALIIFCLFITLAFVSCAHHVDFRSHYRQEAADVPTNDNAQQLWFDEQILDHFDPLNFTTWSQQYFINDEFCTSDNCPVIVNIGGEGPEKITSITAQELGAFLVSVEHRFYGESVPTNDTSFDNLQYLSSQQALADLATIKQHVIDTYTTYDLSQSAWITVGGSYSGCLSAWARLKYPHLYAGAIASSGPVRAWFNFPEYFEVVTDSLRTYGGDQCITRIQAATTLAEQYIQTENGRSSLAEMFNTCSDVSNETNDRATFFDSLSDPLAGTVQYAKEGDIEHACDVLINSDTDPLQALANLMDEFQAGECVESNYSNMIAEMLETDPASEFLADRSWTYQTCFEFGFYQTTTDYDPFSQYIDIDYFKSMCYDLFAQSGETEVIPDTTFTNFYYGSDRPHGTNIIFPNGTVDPWHALGVTDDVSPEEPHFMIPDGSHCSDLYAEADTDPVALSQIRFEETNLMKSWIKQWRN